MVEEMIRKYGLFVLFGAILFQVVFCEGGVSSYIRTKLEIRRIDASIARLETENIYYAKEIGRLQQDDKYLEDVVRKKYGLLREGEKLYRVER